jgi:hypothetical protein
LEKVIFILKKKKRNEDEKLIIRSLKIEDKNNYF